MYALGIDLGSSYMKAAVFDLEENKAVFQEHIPAVKRREDSCAEIFEIPADEIFLSVKQMIDSLAASFPLDRILFSTQMHGFILRSEEENDIYVSWQDSRSILPLFPGGRNAVEILDGLLSEDDWEQTGVRAKPSLGLCNLYAMIFGQKKVSPCGELFTLGSYLIWRLTGHNICHSTSGAPLGLANVSRNEFAPWILEKTSLAGIKLPVLSRHDFEICGSYRFRGREIPVLPDYGDQQVSVAGAMAMPGEAVLNIATGGQLCYLASEAVPGPYENRPYFHAQYLRTVSNMPGGRNLNVIIQFLREVLSLFGGKNITENEIWEMLNRFFCRSQTDLAADSLFYPTQNRFDGGGISGIRPSNLTVNNLFSALYEDIANIYTEHLPLLTGSFPPAGLVFSGGVSWHNDALVQAIAEKSCLPWRKSPVKNEVFNGMFRLLLVSCGMLRDIGSERSRILSV